MSTKPVRRLPATMRQLHVFDAVARHSGFGRAATELHLAQPTVSMQVKQLAETVGLPLFEQIGKQIYLTDAGRALRATCAEMFDAWARLEMQVADLKGLKQGRLRIAAVTTAKYVVPRLLGPFCRAHPGVDVAMEVGNRSAIIERLARNEDDLTIMGVPPRGMDIVSHPFAENPLVIIAPRGHALAGRRRIALARLAGQPFLMREKGSGTRLAADRFLRERGLRLDIKMELGSNEAIKQAVAGGLGLSFLSLHALGPDAAPRSLVALDVEGLPIRRHWYIVHPAGKRLSVVAQAFFDYLKTEGSQISFPSVSGFSARGGTVQRA
ncbi:MAG: LysR substrate-binding domain-containing protein [Betaproteobacteria bacterium]